MGVTSVICSLVGTVYPAYASFRAIESAAYDDDKQWLTYWFPFYYQVKLLVVLWMIAPQTQGAKRLYEEVIRPFLFKNAKHMDPVFRGTQAVLDMNMTNQLAKLVEQHGPTAAESVTTMLSQLKGSNMDQLTKLARADPKLLDKVLNMAVEALP